MNTRSPAEPIADELRAKRRAAKAAVNRADILDAAERIFAERGLTDGSLRDIAKNSGFSTAAIYNYFESKQHLLAETLVRRGTDLLDVIDTAAGIDGSPMDRLHRIVDDTVAFFEAYPDFGQVLRHVRESELITASVLTEHAGDRNVFPETLALMTAVLEEGQRLGEIRDGSPGALIHLYMTLVNEHVYLAGSANPGVGSLSLEQFHAVIDGALRRSTAAPKRAR